VDNENSNTKVDKRPPPKPRKNALLWQQYLYWDELMQMRKKHALRLSSIKAGKSKMDGAFEQQVINNLTAFIDGTKDENGKRGVGAKGQMIFWAEQAGKIYTWLTSIRGIGAHTAAKLIALYDDVAKFPTASKFLRFGGFSTYSYWVKEGKIIAPQYGYKMRKPEIGDWVLLNTFCEPGMPGATEITKGHEWLKTKFRYHVTHIPGDGEVLTNIADRALEGWCLPYNNRLKSELWLLAGHFIKQHNETYTSIYYAEKERQRRIHPEKVKENGHFRYTDGHIDYRGKRKMIKIFCQHFWAKWREFEGLSVTQPYVQAILGHQNIIQPPEVELA
jgi:hypothetical protein